MILLFDPFSGISGDMTVGAFLDAGLPLEVLRESYSKLGLAGLEVSAESAVRCGIGGTRFRVQCPPQQGHRHFSHIRRMIDSSSLEPSVSEKALRIFQKLAEAEASVHGTTPEKVHFHEVGALDSIADIVGAAVGLSFFKVSRCFSAPVNVGYGTVVCEHGTLPVPPPATALLLRGFETFSGTVQSEMTTPTGAAVLAAMAERSLPSRTMRREIVGYGAGDRDHKQVPNMLRVFLGPEVDLPAGDEVLELQANIDDMNPEFYAPLAQKLFAAGVLDVFYQPVIMKQGRPGVLATVLCEPSLKQVVSGVLFRESTTLGVRYLTKSRDLLDRRSETVETPYGPVRVKIGCSGAATLNYAPEFEDCRRLAETAGVPVKDVYNAAMGSYWASRHKHLDRSARETGQPSSAPARSPQEGED